MYTRVDYEGSVDLRSVSMVALIQQLPFAGRRLVPKPDLSSHSKIRHRTQLLITSSAGHDLTECAKFCSALGVAVIRGTRGIVIR